MTVQYFIILPEGQKGPFTITQLTTMWGAGQITSETLHWFEGLAEWIPLGDFVEQEMASQRREEKRAAVASAAPKDLPSGQWSRREYYGLLALAVLIPVLAFLIGFIGVWNPAKRQQAGQLMGISLLVMVVAGMLLGLL